MGNSPQNLKIAIVINVDITFVLLLIFSCTCFRLHHNFLEDFLNKISPVPPNLENMSLSQAMSFLAQSDLLALVSPSLILPILLFLPFILSFQLVSKKCMFLSSHSLRQPQININICNKKKKQIEERSSHLLRNLSSCEKKPEKNSGLNGIRTHDLCDASAELYQLSYQANWELLKLHSNCENLSSI